MDKSTLVQLLDDDEMPAWAKLGVLSRIDTAQLPEFVVYPHFSDRIVCQGITYYSEATGVVHVKSGTELIGMARNAIKDVRAFHGDE